MATREEIGIALEIINMVNQMGTQLRGQATHAQRVNTKIQVIVNDIPKRDKLISGLVALGVDISVLNSDRGDIIDVAQYVLDNIPERTKT